MDQQQPVQTQEPVQQPVQQPTTPQDGSQTYVYVGLAIGALISLLTITSFFISKNLNSSKQIGQSVKTIPVGGQNASPTITPTVTPVTITTKQDLATQQTALDSTDLTSVLKDLELNSSDSSQFAL
jgi:hypothetical protein